MGASRRRKKVLTEAPENGRVRFSAAQSDSKEAKKLLGDLSEGASFSGMYRALRRARLSPASAFHNALYLKVAEKAEQSRRPMDESRRLPNVPAHPKGWYRDAGKRNFYDFLLRFLTVTPKIFCYLPQKLAAAHRRLSRSLENSWSAYRGVKSFFKRFGGTVLVVVLAVFIFGFIAYHAALPVSYTVVVDQTPLGLVENRAELDSALKEVEASVSNVIDEQFVFPKEVGVSLSHTVAPRYLSHAELVQKLHAYIEPYLRVGYALYLDGKFALAANSPSTLQNLLDDSLQTVRERTGDEELIALGTQSVLYQNAPASAFYGRSALNELLVYHIDPVTGKAQLELMQPEQRTVQPLGRTLAGKEGGESDAYRYTVRYDDEQALGLTINYGTSVVEDKIEKIAYNTTYRESDTVYTGAQYVYQRGVSGERVTSYRVDYSGGEEVSRRVLAQSVSKEPIDQIVLIGRKPLPPNTIIDDGSNVVSVTDQRCFITPIYLEKGISSYFGYRSFDGSFHTGVDMPAAYGTPIYAAMSGIVVEAGSSGSSYGTVVKILHPNGLYTYYAHLSAITVRVGDSVSQNQMIGNIGTTGYATGPHVHFEVRLSDGETQVDPLEYLIGMEGA